MLLKVYKRNYLTSFSLSMIFSHKDLKLSLERTSPYQQKQKMLLRITF